MIKSKKDLLYYITEDRKHSHVPTNFIATILSEPKYMIGRYLFFLRYAEYAKNVIYPDCKILGKILLVYYHWRMRKLSWKLGFQIPENVFGPGICIYAYGTIIVNPCARVGKNCTIYPGVTIGGKVQNGYPKIGDNVFIGLGAKVLGGVTIGNNAYIAPNAIVVKDVEEGCIVGGVPARVLKKN